MAIILNSKYEPLLTGGTRYSVITGGRGSGKSFAISTLLVLLSDIDNKTILYTRYTLTNAETSIMPEFLDKIERLGWGNRFHKSGNDIINTKSGGKILFRGIKTSSGVNTAALKSIPNLKMWVNDESEELVDERVFDTIDLSVRDKESDCKTWIILNPADIGHFIYRRFFKQNGVIDSCNLIKDDITYIYTTYLDNAKNLDSNYLQQAEKCKAVDDAKYNNLWLGKWRTLSEGNIYHDWEQITDEQYPCHLSCWYGVDWGFSNDPMAIVRLCFEPSTHTLYVKELCYAKGRLTAYAAEIIRKDILNKKTLLYEGENWAIFHKNGCCWIDGKEYRDSAILEDNSIIEDEQERAIIRKKLSRLLKLYEEVYCDPARPEQIYEMRTQHDINSIPATNTDKVGRIEYLKYFSVKYVGSNIGVEYVGYRWMTDKKDTSIYINKPQDGDDHLMDAINYGGVTHLRRLRVANKIGEN